MTPTAFGLDAARDPQFVFELRQGRAVRPPLEARISAYLDRAEANPEGSRRLRRRRGK